MKLTELLEQENNIAKVTQWISKNYDEMKMARELDDEIPNWIDDWEDEYENEFEWYNEFGRGEAEDVVINNTIYFAKQALKINLTNAEEMKVYNWIESEYNMKGF